MGKDSSLWLDIAHSDIPPMPEGFADRAAWDAIHWPFSASGTSALDAAVIAWQLANQERIGAAADAAHLTDWHTGEVRGDSSEKGS